MSNFLLYKTQDGTSSLDSSLIYDTYISGSDVYVKATDGSVLTISNSNVENAEAELKSVLSKIRTSYSSLNTFLTDKTCTYEFSPKIDIPSVRKNTIGWQDFADSATSEANPIVQSNVNGGEVLLTNNNNGTLTDGNTTVNAETTVEGLNDMWDTTSNTLVFKDTGIEKNDVILLRVHLNVSASIIDEDFDVKLDFYDDVNAGGNRVFGFQKQLHNETLSAGVFREKMVDMKFFIGESILNGSATISLVRYKIF